MRLTTVTTLVGLLTLKIKWLEGFFMNIKSINLDGLALDYAVALAAGKDPKVCVVTNLRDGVSARVSYTEYRVEVDGHTYHPSESWSDAGEVIKNHNICMERAGEGFASIVDGKFTDETRALMVHGRTQLISAMRCFVVDALGDEVAVPDEITVPIGRQGLVRKYA